MAPTKKRNFKKAEFLTAAKFAEMHGISGRENKKLVGEAFRVMNREGLQVKNEFGNYDIVICREHDTHNEPSCFRAHPLYHDLIMKRVREYIKKHAKESEK